MTQLAQSTRIKLTATINKIKQRYNHHCLVGCVYAANVKPAHGNAHNQQCQHPRRCHLFQHTAVRITLNDRQRLFLIHDKVVTYLADFVFHHLRRYLLRVILHQSRTRGKIYIRRFNTFKLVEPSLHICGTACTRHTHNGNSFLFHYSICFTHTGTSLPSQRNHGQYLYKIYDTANIYKTAITYITKLWKRFTIYISVNKKYAIITVKNVYISLISTYPCITAYTVSAETLLIPSFSMILRL